MKIAVGSDHRGYELRQHLSQWLTQQEYEVVELGPSTYKACDYTDAAYAVGRAVSEGRCEFGILMCGSGLGTCISANKVPGIRAALVHDEIGATISRSHNNANVLCLPADMLGHRIIDRIVRTWLTTVFEGGRHARRLRKIQAIEDGGDPTEVDDSTTVTDSEDV